MQISENEFRLLRELVVGESAKHDLGPKAEAWARATLQERGLLDGGAVTEAGRETLERYRVKRAIFQAAGLSSRFAPISYDTPKGLLEVRGEPLVERQIRQLHEVGITDITIVVGHLAKSFEYLTDKYGVKLVFNPDYATYNTLVTIHLVRHLLDNAYILYSDHYYPENLFHAYEYQSYYPTRYDNPTREWVQVYDEDRNSIDMEKSDHGGEYLHGFAYITRETAKEIVPYLEEAYDGVELRHNFWEHAIWLGRGHLHLQCQVLPHGAVNEFDKLSELLAFDPDFLDRLSSPALDNICRELGCAYRDITDCYPLSSDPRDASCHFSVGGSEYVYRYANGDGDKAAGWEIAPFI